MGIATELIELETVGSLVLPNNLRHEKIASWFLRQPYFDTKRNVNSNVYFFDGSSGIPAGQ